MEATAVYEMTNDIHAERNKSKAARVIMKSETSISSRDTNRMAICYQFWSIFMFVSMVYRMPATYKLFFSCMEINTQFDMAAL